MGQVKVPGMRASAVGCGGNNCQGGAQVSWARSQVLGFQARRPFLNTTLASAGPGLQGEKEGVCSSPWRQAGHTFPTTVSSLRARPVSLPSVTPALNGAGSGTAMVEVSVHVCSCDLQGGTSATGSSFPSQLAAVFLLWLLGGGYFLRLVGPIQHLYFELPCIPVHWARSQSSVLPVQSTP